MDSVHEIAERARAAAPALAASSAALRDAALTAMAHSLCGTSDTILRANQSDVDAFLAAGGSSTMADRLALTPQRLLNTAEGLRQVAALADPLGISLAEVTRPNGLRIRKVTVPLGVVGIIYESRPNVTADAAGLCIKAGCPSILRGGTDAFNSNMAIVLAIQSAVESVGLPRTAVQAIPTTDRNATLQMMHQTGLIDVLIPRGGAGLIRFVLENSRVPVIETGTGNCHTYIDATADMHMALAIAVNAKCSRPSVCNAMETLLVHSAVAQTFLTLAAPILESHGVEIRGCERTCAILPAVVAATESDWDTEYLDLILAVRVVDSLADAIDHIAAHGTRHSEAIVTANLEAAEQFTSGVDAAAVYVNASTRFTDGYEFGFGAELGISTQKLHARGPMGLHELTSYKYVVHGTGQIR